MSRPFRFAEFVIDQKVNAQKVGTDSMLLGAWTNEHYNSILDVGTGTGILALMLAQQNQGAGVVAIEPEKKFLEEALTNFSNSKFKDRITGVLSTLQDFSSTSKFDLIIFNPPYFLNSSLSPDEDKNKARHSDDLAPETLYSKAKELMHPNGHLNLVFPFDAEAVHFSAAENAGFFLRKQLRTKREDGSFKRTLVSFSLVPAKTETREMIVKYSDNSYSAEYIEMTRPFYGKQL